MNMKREKTKPLINLKRVRDNPQLIDLMGNQATSERRQIYFISLYELLFAFDSKFYVCA